MELFKPNIKNLIENKDYQGLSRTLSGNPNLSNAGITIPYDIICRTKAHPLHRLCDAVFSGKMTDAEAIQCAQVFLDFGAHIDGDKMQDQGTPILAAASLHAEQLGIFYIENGADIHYTYQNNGESALHWAAFCGRDKLVTRLIRANAPIDNPDNTHHSTPLGWAIHCLQSNDTGNKHHQVDCIKLLLRNEADMNKLDQDKNDYLLALASDDPELKQLLTR
jgi:ankyrin repeat protein